MFCTATGRRPQLGIDPRRWYDVADSDLPYEDKLRAYREMADEHFAAERYADFVAGELAGLDDVALGYFSSTDFDRLLVETVRSTFPAHEHEQFVDHYRGLLAAWVRDHGGSSS